MSTLPYLIDFEKLNKDKQAEPMLEFLATDINTLNDRTEFQEVNKMITDYQESKWDLIFIREICGYPFVISFSERQDSLPLWLTYASNGKGICLKFDKSEIRNHFKPKEKEDYVLSDTGNCHYLETPEFKLLKQNIKSLYSNYNNDVFRNNYSLFNKFFLQAAFLKNKAYSYENEWRVVILGKDYLFRPKLDNFTTCAKVQIPLKCLKGIRLG
ncbi:MAG: DUF2971 domain-containing protein, partial [Bacteroidales bacterium]|nr:DUF2971 domain-containing protein [Bacteroidales bacterium]